MLQFQYLKVMAELRSNESIEAGVRRIARDLLAQGRTILKAEKDTDLAVHETRKLLKKLRALVRMVRDALGEETYKAANIAFRDAGKLLSDARDHYVLRQCLSEIATRYKPYLKVRVFKTLERRLELHHQREVEVLMERSDVFSQLDGVLGEMESAVDAWSLPGSGFDLLEDSLSRVYERGRKALEVVEEDPDPEKFHEWRKRVKYLYYQFGYLQLLWPMRMEQTEAALSHLSDLLGKDHDFAVFHARLEPHAGLIEDPVHAILLRNLLDHERQLLQAEALPLGKRLYAEEPGAFTSRLRTYWSTLREKEA